MNATLIDAESAGISAEIKQGRARLYLPEKEIRDLRTQRLRSLLNFAKHHSPWYKKTLAPFDVEGFTEDDLAEIPPLDKRTLMANWDRIVTTPSLTLDIAESHIAKMGEDRDLLYLQDRFHVLATSGSSGKRGVYVYDRDGWIQRSATNRRFPWLTKDFLPISMSKNRVRVAQVVITNAVYGMYASAKTYTSESIENIYVPMTLPVDEICTRLNAQPIDVLTGLPSTLHKLCLESAKGNLSIDPKIVYSTAEPLYAPIRTLIKETWPDSCLFNALVSSEGIYARNCHAESKEMHLNDDICIVQPVDKHDRPTVEGVLPEKLYLTNLVNYTMPLIRYESPDQLVFLDKKCQCGCNFQLIEEPQGRPEFDFIYPGNIFVHHLVFVTPILHERNIREYQVWQTSKGADIKTVTVGAIDKRRLIQVVTNGLTDLGLAKPEINVDEVPQLDYPASGKLRRFVKLS
jgi:phenylacetate-CoA ligase